MELPHNGTVRGSTMCSFKNASVASPACSRVVVDASMRGSSPERVKAAPKKKSAKPAGKALAARPKKPAAAKKTAAKPVAKKSQIKPAAKKKKKES